MKVMIAQLNPTIGDIVGNTKMVLASLEKGRKSGAEFIVFPEMTLCGYAPDDMVLHDTFIQEMQDHLDMVVRASTGICAIVGLIRKNPLSEEKDLLNSAAIIHDGQLLGFYDKWLLPTYDLFDERRYFSRGKNVGVWQVNGKRIAVVICEDMWQNAGKEISGVNYPQDPVKALQPYKPDVLFNLTASPFQTRKADVRIEVCRAAVKTLGCPVIYTCQVGANGMVVFDGYSLYVNKDQDLAAVAKGFCEDHIMVDTEKKCPPLVFQHDDMTDLHAALKLGISDFFSKAHRKKAIIGISGGLDSALVAKLAVDALGAQNILGISMPSEFTSQASREDAQQLATNLGIDFIEIPIDKSYNHFLELLNPAFEAYGMGACETRDITEENLQARVRGLILMAFANKYGRLVLNTGNKSEMALGYCTLYGDMVGALSVIGDVTKTECYQLSNWLNRNEECIPNRIVEKEPSAELRHHQKDTDTLPPYEIIDQIIKDYVENYKDIHQIAQDHNFDHALVTSIITRIYRAEHKRRQAPPSLRVSKKSFAIGRKKPLHFTGLSSERVY
jgi:NAD+ synthase (glutamine-hydrolysing)